MKEKYKKYNLETIVSQSTTYAEVLRKLGNKISGGGISHVKKYILQYDISTKHFLGQGWSKGLHKEHTNAKSLSEVMIENSSYSRSALKKRLLKENIVENVCSECKLSGEWNGHPITMHLDHINGINNDHRLENLRMLCPNCHSQTNTYAGKNNKCEPILNHCECGKQIKNVSTCCKSCSKKLQTRKVKVRPSNEQLLKDIEELGYSGTGRKYKVSDNTIRKWIK